MKLPFQKLPDKPRRSGYVDEQIDEAIKRGEFDNLEGKGKPLNLQGDLADRKAMRAKIRSDAGYTAPWEDVAREITVATKRVEASARRALEYRQAGLASKKADKAKIENDFALALRDIEAQVRGVNSLVLKYNLLIPPQLPHLHLPRLQLDKIWVAIGRNDMVEIKNEK